MMNKINLTHDEQNRLCLKDSKTNCQNPVYVDFLSDATNYRRNVLYLRTQFNDQQTQLANTGFTPINTYDLITIPQLIVQQ